jgi:ubiquinone/menaquinone biosynthesis C-methylase UbiE
MPIEDASFVGSIPENYDRYLGPVLFEPYAADLVSRLNVAENSSVLELACGTGIVTRRLRDALAPTVRLVATDLQEPMMEHARRKFGAEEAIEWKQVDATELPFGDGSFDAVVCQFGVMFFPDKENSAREVFRVLKPGGTFLFNVWDAIELNDLAHIAHTVITEFFADNPPDFYEIPFSFHDRSTIGSMLSTAGFTKIELTEVSLPARADSAKKVTTGLVHGNPIVTAIRERQAEKLPEIEAAVERAIAAQCGNAPVRARMRTLVCKAVR